MSTSDPPSVNYPLLGEPVVVEFVNTFYDDPDGVTDFLATNDLATGWFRSLDPPLLTNIDFIDEKFRIGLVELRTAIRAVFDAPPATDIDAALSVIELCANAAPGMVRLCRNDSGSFESTLIHDTNNPAAAAAALAHHAITIATNSSKGPVLVCDRPACNMRFFQHHRRRRYCNPACANSDRQRRFQQRNTNRDHHE